MPSKRCCLNHDTRASYSVQKFKPGDLVKIQSRQSSMIGIHWNSLGVVVEHKVQKIMYLDFAPEDMYSVLVDDRVVFGFYPSELRLVS